jgi:hypothetical protein
LIENPLRLLPRDDLPVYGTCEHTTNVLIEKVSELCAIVRIAMMP